MNKWNKSTFSFSLLPLKHTFLPLQQHSSNFVLRLLQTQRSVTFFFRSQTKMVFVISTIHKLVMSAFNLSWHPKNIKTICLTKPLGWVKEERNVDILTIDKILMLRSMLSIWSGKLKCDASWFLWDKQTKLQITKHALTFIFVVLNSIFNVNVGRPPMTCHHAADSKSRVNWQKLHITLPQLLSRCLPQLLHDFLQLWKSDFVSLEFNPAWSWIVREGEMRSPPHGQQWNIGWSCVERAVKQHLKLSGRVIAQWKCEKTKNSTTTPSSVSHSDNWHMHHWLINTLLTLCSLHNAWGRMQCTDLHARNWLAKTSCCHETCRVKWHAETRPLHGFCPLLAASQKTSRICCCDTTLHVCDFSANDFRKQCVCSVFLVGHRRPSAWCCTAQQQRRPESSWMLTQWHLGFGPV